MATILERYCDAFPTSSALTRRARARLPDGVTSDSRWMEPFPVYVARASGAHKWSVEGRRLLDLWAGHGSILLGHANPQVAAAIQQQSERGSHYGACHELELEWAESVCRLVPSAELVRFTSSGTEAVLLAVQIARTATGRRGLVRFEGHYHGWHGSLLPNRDEPGLVRVLPPTDVEAVGALLERDQDIAAVILEPSGPCSGVVPLSAEYLRDLRHVTASHGVVLIFDEIVTGFRMAAGGLQAIIDVEPDLTTLAKILSGGLPGGAVAGRRELMTRLAKDNAPGPDMPHLGTHNANPTSAAAGVATLRVVEEGEVYTVIDARAAAIRARLNSIFADRGLDWAAYGAGSCVKLLVGHGRLEVAATDFDPTMFSPQRLLSRSDPELWTSLRLALLMAGVDASQSSFTTAAFGEDEVDELGDGFEHAITWLRDEGLIPN